MAHQSFDLVVVGSGSAGATVARTCRAGGWRVAIVDSRPFGGTCALRGCDPKRVLIGAAELVDWSRRFGANGVVRGDLGIDWPALMRFKRTFTEPIPGERERSFREAGISMFHGRAHFAGRSVLAVDGETLEGRFFAIAAGAMHRKLGIPGEEHIATSTAFLDLPELPPRIVLVGGGYISFEFAHLAARAGAQVRILHGGPRPLDRFDPDLVDMLVATTRDIGVEVEVNARVSAIEKRGDRVRIHAKMSEGERVFEADLAVHGAGRVPEIDDLALDVAGVARTAKGVAVNEFLQSPTNPSVYAAGDAADAGGLPLTPVAGDEGEIVAANLLHGNRRTADFSGLATIVYTIPPLAQVGMSQAEAKERGLKVNVVTADSTEWFSSRRLAASRSGFKVLIEDESETVLGAVIFGLHAEELANLFALAIRAKLRTKDLRDVLYAYPTAGSDVEYMVGE